MNQMKAFMKRHIAALLVLLLVAVSIPVGVTWAKYASSQKVTSGSGLELKATAANQFTIDKKKMWDGLTKLSTRPTAIKLCQGKDLPDGVTRQDYIEDSDRSNGQIGLYTSTDGKTVYIAPIGNKTAKMYTQANCNAMFQYEKIGYNNATVSQLTAIDGLSNLITDNATDMSDMFGGCKAVQVLDVSGFDTSKVTNMRDMFGGCKAVQTLDVSRFNTSKVTDMKGMFGDCQKLTGLNVSNFNTANVTNMFEMFYNCQSLTSLDVSRFDTSNVLNLQEMFLWCSGLTELDLSNFKISPNLTNIAFMFENCRNLEKLTLGSNFNPGNSTKLKSLRHLFNECHSLKTLDLSNFDTSKILDTWGMFGKCQKLTTIYASEKFVLAQVKDNYYPGKGSGETFVPGDTSRYMFDGCTDGLLVGGNGTRFDSNKPTDKTYAFIDKPGKEGYFTAPFTTDDYILDRDKMWNSLQELFMSTSPSPTAIAIKLCQGKDLPDGVTRQAYIEDSTLGNGRIGLYTSADGKTVYIAPIGNKTAKMYTQANCSNLFSQLKMELFENGIKNLDLSNLDTSNATNMANMFSGNGDMETLVLGDFFDTQHVTDMSYMFQDCSGLTSLDLTKFDTSKVTDMRDMFNGCSGLTSLDVTNFDTKNVTDMRDMFKNCSGLTGLDVTNFNTSNVTTMFSMFEGCSGLTSLDVTHFDTSNVTTMVSMFRDCRGLTGLDVTNFDTKNVTDMTCMFDGCSGLTSLDVTNFDTKNVTCMSAMFRACRGLTSLDVTNFDTKNVTDMTYMFQDCSGLTSLDVTKFDTSKVTTMSDMFNGCSGLTSLDVTNFDTSNVYYMGNMFQNCSGLTSLDLSSFDTAKTIAIGSMFQGCNKLRTIYADPNKFSTKKLLLTSNTDFYYDVFTGCTALQGGRGTKYNASLAPKDQYTYAHVDGGTANPGYFTDKNAPTEFTIDKSKMQTALKALTNPTAIKLCKGSEVPKGAVLKTSVQADGSGKIGLYQAADNQTVYIAPVDDADAKMYAPTDCSKLFDSCRKITLLDCGNLNTLRVTNMSNMFSWCSGLTSLVVSSFDTANVTDMSNMFFGCSALTSLDVSRFNTANVTDMSNMFNGCRALKGLNLSGFNTAAVRNMSYMFNTCMALTSLDVSSFDTANVTDMSSMFSNCLALTSLDVSRFNTANVTGMSRMFYCCKALTSLDVRSFDTANVTDMSNMFYVCQALTSLDLSSFNTAKVTDMEYMFWSCSKLEQLNVSKFNTANVTNMENMLGNLINLKSVDISSFNTTKVTNMSYMFTTCNQLRTIYASTDFVTDQVTDSQNMFVNCDKLVGGKGTQFKKNMVNKTYARIDKVGQKGYFTAKTAGNAADLTKTVTVDLNGLSNIDAAPVN